MDTRDEISPLDYVADHVRAVMIAGNWYDVEPGTFREVPSWRAGRSYRFEDADDGETVYASADTLDAIRWLIVHDDE